MIFEWFFFAEEKHPRNDHNVDTGLMQQMSIFYAMGFSLMAQGAFSVCYHVCCIFFLFFSTIFFRIHNNIFFLRYAQQTSAFNSTQLWCMSFVFFAMSNFINSDTQMQQPVLIQLCSFLVFWFLLKPWLFTRLRGLCMGFSCFVMWAWLFSLLLMPTILA